MGLAADIVVGSLQELLPGSIDTFTMNQPLWSRIYKGGTFNNRELKGPWVNFDVRTGGPGSLVTDRSGATLLGNTLAQKGKQGTEYGAHLIYSWTVPLKTLNEASTEQHYSRLVTDYGDAALAHLHEIMSAQMARGASSSGSGESGAEGFFTLNSDQAYTPLDTGSSRQGLFEWAEAGSQTDTVHGLVKQGGASGVTGWYHQYGNMSAMSMGGRKIMRTVRDKANQQGASLQGGIDLLLGDDQSYQNYVENLDDQVVTAVVENDPGVAKVREGVKFGTADFFSDPYIDITDTTSFTSTEPQNGVIYMLNSEFWDMFSVGDDYSTKKPFEVDEPILTINQPVVGFRIRSYINCFCSSLRNQGVVTGGATA